MEYEGGRKRARFDASFNGNGGFKKSRPEMESFTPGIGSKSKPCTKFFSTAGCPFGEGCHFLHYVPGGLKTVSHLINVGGSPALPPSARNPVVPPSFPDGSSPPAVKTRLCNKFNSAEGCKFGEKCHFAHGEWELGKPTLPSYEDHRGRMGGRMEPPPPSHGLAASFGASSTAKISVDSSLAGAIIGKNGVNSKQICRATGAKLSIREHETDPNLRNIELEGTFDQIKQASTMVRELIVNVGSSMAANHTKSHHHGGGGGGGGTGHSSGSGSNFKTKICDNFTKGSCTFGERCHFAHGAHELRKTGI
ncbi:zinc finger CCCH domain-containing protein 14-like [Humulus lupulus]|uniref:zinc finger CCCH domain-containing protein 14-like n=1 Tax=Humulus lupulus TaxID=3486 RepID=UPI002B40699C|nr:zinc finger CCCH domain-containing protein 14-like [Humulus lupulus]